MSSQEEAARTARAQAMEERVRRTAGERGISGLDLDLLGAVHWVAMAARIQHVAAEAPDFLHPGRTALILMLDVEESDPLTLAAAMTVDSERPELDVSRSLLECVDLQDSTDPLADLDAVDSSGVVRQFLDRLERASAIADSVPVAGRSSGGAAADDDLLERLVVADERVQRIALAERLDHLRHAHLWDDPERKRRAHATAVAVYAPLAARVHERLARRYAWWCAMFAKRHLPEGS